MTTLLDEIKAKGISISPRDDGAIAAAVSVGRTKTVSTHIGIGTILDTLGPVPGAAALDALQAAAASNSAIKWALVLINEGTLDVGDPTVQAQINGLPTAILSASQASQLIALSAVPDPVTAQEVSAALEGT